MLKNNKGITLIALVITIIVLLILAGVSIAMLTGENGILNQADKAGDETNRAEALERVNMELNAQLANAMAGDPFDAVSKIQSNIGTLPKGYSIETPSVTGGTSATAYDKNNVLTITLKGEGIASTSGTVRYVTDHWEVQPVKEATTPTE